MSTFDFLGCLEVADLQAEQADFAVSMQTVDDTLASKMPCFS